MKLFLSLLIALGAFAAVSDSADARKRVRAPAPYGYQYYAPPAYQGYQYYGPPPAYGYRYRESEYSDSPDCIDARNLDPGGNYADYPCWARRALAPKRDR